MLNKSRHYFFHIARVKLFQSLRLYQTLLSNSYHWNALAESKRQCYVWDLWYPNSTNQSCQSLEEIIARVTVLPQMPQLLNKFPNRLELSYSQKNTASQKHVGTFKCKRCYQEFPGFYDLLSNKNSCHGFPIMTANVEQDDIINELDDMNLKQELSSC